MMRSHWARHMRLFPVPNVCAYEPKFKNYFRSSSLVLKLATHSFFSPNMMLHCCQWVITALLQRRAARRHQQRDHHSLFTFALYPRSVFITRKQPLHICAIYFKMLRHHHSTNSRAHVADCNMRTWHCQTPLPVLTRIDVSAASTAGIILLSKLCMQNWFKKKGGESDKSTLPLIHLDIINRLTRPPGDKPLCSSPSPPPSSLWSNPITRSLAPQRVKSTWTAIWSCRWCLDKELSSSWRFNGHRTLVAQKLLHITCLFGRSITFF